MEKSIRNSEIKTTMNREKFKRSIAPYLFVLPNTLIFLIFIVIPSFIGLVYSFHEYDGLNPMEFIGFSNYIEILQDKEYWGVMTKTFSYAFIVVPLLFACSLGIAMMLIQEIRGKGIFRAVFYWPVMISFIIVGLTWKWIFGSSFGVLNYLLELIGLEPIGWLTDSFFAKMSVIIATLWSRIGFYMVIFIAGLQAIPNEYYEAAKIDGASKLRTFWSMTLPLLKPTSLLVVILSLIDAFKQFPLMYALTGGGPGKETMYIVQYVYEFGFVKQELGMASAMSVLLFIMIGIFTIVQFRMAKGGTYE